MTTTRTKNQPEKIQGIEIKTPVTLVITGLASDRKGKKVIQRQILRIALNETNRLYLETAG